MKQSELSSSMEDYLEAILALDQELEVVRAKDISNFLEVKPPSVTSALNTLANEGLVDYEKYSYVKLTEEGRRLADKILNRHEMLIQFFDDVLNLETEVAARDACKVEHVISSETSRKLKKFVEFIEAGPESGAPRWLDSFEHFFQTGERKNCPPREETSKITDEVEEQ